MIIVLGTVALETIVGLGYKVDQVLTGLGVGRSVDESSFHVCFVANAIPGEVQSFLDKNT